MASLACVQDTSVRFNSHGDKTHTTSQARTEQPLCQFQNTIGDSKDSSQTPRYMNTETMDSHSSTTPSPSPSSPRRTKLRRALALEDMLARINLNDTEDQTRDIQDTSYAHLSWDMLCDISCEATDAKTTQKPRVRAATLSSSTSTLKKLDLEEKISAALDGLDSRAFVRPPQAGFLLKKTLRAA